MIEAVIFLLIQLAVLAICFFLILWVLGIIGIELPPKVVQLLWVVVILIAVLLLWRVIVGAGGLRLGRLL